MKSNISQKGPYSVYLESGKKYLWCVCGLSRNQPFCDNTHVGTEFKPLLFTAKETNIKYLCGCKQTKNPPFCDRTHMRLDTTEQKRKINYANNEITVVWQPELCTHSTLCFSGLPEVFNPGIRKWIDPNAASTDRIIKQVNRCPSGALTFFYNDKKPE